MSPCHRLGLKPIQILLHSLKSKGWQETLPVVLCQCSIVIIIVIVIATTKIQKLHQSFHMCGLSWQHKIRDDQAMIQKVFYHPPILERNRQEEAFHKEQPSS
eukprot:39930_1